MRTVPLKQVFRGISGLLGLDLTVSERPQFATVMASLATWLETGWRYDFWPELMLVEQRAYRDTWASGATYASGDEVFFATDSLYYSANSSPNTPAAGESPASAPTKWTALTSFARYVALYQTGQTPIGEVSRVCRYDPRTNPTRPGELRFDVTGQGIVPDCRAGAQVYVEFRTVPPQFSSDEYDVGTAYTTGTVVFDPTTWECYRALQSSTGQAVTDAAYWEIVAFPAFLRRFVERAVYTDLLKNGGQSEKAASELSEAYGFLVTEQDMVFAQQGQQAAVRARTY